MQREVHATGFVFTTFIKLSGLEIISVEEVHFSWSKLSCDLN